jgi:phage-related protein
MKIHTYYSDSGRDKIMEYISSLPQVEQIDAFSVLQCMENDEFEKIEFKRWQKKIYEVYFQKHNRIFYVAADGGNIYLLHACKKQKNRTEQKDKNTVLKRAKELGTRLGKKFV